MDTPNRLAPWMVRITAAWLLVGAFFKLFVGTPNDLPGVVRDLPLDVGLTYNLAISIELALGFVALVKPSWAWFLLSGAMVVFDVILSTQLGSDNCGCFGSKITMPPWLMMVIDSGLLVGMLASRPWRNMPRAAPVPVAVIAMAVGLSLPWFMDRQVSTTTLTVDGQDVPPPETPSSGWIASDIENWGGRDIHDSPLAQPPLRKHIDFDSFIPDGLWVFWRATCDHCAEHLAHLATTETGERIVTLVQLREKHDTEGNRAVHLLPTGGFVQNAALPESLEYVIQTPGAMLVENGEITRAKEAVSQEEHF